MKTPKFKVNDFVWMTEHYCNGENDPTFYEVQGLFRVVKVTPGEAACHYVIESAMEHPLSGMRIHAGEWKLREPKTRIVTPRQLEQGYAKLGDNDESIRYDYVQLSRLPDGNTVVLEPVQ